MKKFLIPTFVFLLIAMPLLSLAAPFTGPIVPDCQNYTYKDSRGNAITECQWGFDEFIKLINNIINYSLFVLALPIAAIMFAFAGIKLVTSGGSEEARGTAKNVFTNTAIGLIIAAAAYLIVSLILSILSPGNWTWIGFN